MAEPPPPDIRQMFERLNEMSSAIGDLTREKNEMSSAIGDLTRENQGLRKDIDTLRKTSPANIADEKKFTSLVAASVTTALDAKADSNLRVKLPDTLAALLLKRPYNGSSPNTILYLDEFDDTFLPNFKGMTAVNIVGSYWAYMYGPKFDQDLGRFALNLDPSCKTTFDNASSTYYLGTEIAFLNDTGSQLVRDEIEAMLQRRTPDQSRLLFNKLEHANHDAPGFDPAKFIKKQFFDNARSAYGAELYSWVKVNEPQSSILLPMERALRSTSRNGGILTHVKFLIQSGTSGNYALKLDSIRLFALQLTPGSITEPLELFLPSADKCLTLLATYGGPPDVIAEVKKRVYETFTLFLKLSVNSCTVVSSGTVSPARRSFIKVLGAVSEALQRSARTPFGTITPVFRDLQVIETFDGLSDFLRDQAAIQGLANQGQPAKWVYNDTDTPKISKQEAHELHM